MAPIVLIGVVAGAIAGRGSPSADRPAPTARAMVADADPSASASRSAAPAQARPTPSRRSDWPAAIGLPGATPRPAAATSGRHREEGTDGLMGGIPFGLPNDTPYPEPDRVNRFTIDDVPDSGRASVTTPPWVLGLAGLPSEPRTR